MPNLRPGASDPAPESVLVLLSHTRSVQDNSDHISFREFVYGLSKFGHSRCAACVRADASPVASHLCSMDSNIKFAFLLLDSDRSGSLEEHEIVPALRSALASPQYGRPHAGVSNQVDINYKCPIRAAVVAIMAASGREHVTLKEFRMLCTRYPRLFLPARFIYEHLYKVAARPTEVVDALPLSAQATLLKHLNHPIPPEGSGCSSFDHYYNMDATKEAKPLAASKPPPVVEVPVVSEAELIRQSKSRSIHGGTRSNMRLDLLVKPVAAA